MMARLQKRAMTRRSWSDDQVMFLRDGNWLWCQYTPWGSPEFMPFSEMGSWPPDDVKDDMRAAWEHHGAQLKAQHADDPLWAEFVFEKNMTAKEAREEHDRQWRTRNGLPIHDYSRPASQSHGD